MDLKTQINQFESELEAKRKLAEIEYYELKNKVHKAIASPDMVLMAFFAGFFTTQQVLDKYSKHPHKKGPVSHKSSKSYLSTLTTIYSLLRFL